MKYISVLTDLLVFTALGQATVQGHSNMVAAGCSDGEASGQPSVRKVCRYASTKRETQKCCQALYRGEGYCLAYSAKHDENTGQ